MNTINQREYYKIFTGPEQTQGFDSVHLGYEAKVSEQVLYKDNTTTFHFPYFAAVTAYSQSGLIEDGATAGPFPAVADRIYSAQKGYGETTPWGDTMYTPDGRWYYTWLYSESGESPVWIDRIYAPGTLYTEDMLIGDYVSYTYGVCAELGFMDIISERAFEPGVMYKYVHNGEQDAQQQVKTLSGSNSLSGLRLHFNTWTPDALDESGFESVLQIAGDYFSSTINSNSPEEADRFYLDLNTKSYLDYKILYNTSYNLLREFSLMCWVKADDWSQVTTSQIVGNMFNGGYQLGFNNFDYTPYFFIADKTYNSVFCFNQNLKNYLTTNMVFNYQTTIRTYTVDGNQELIAINKDCNLIYKLDHLGGKGKFISTPNLSAYHIFADRNNDYIITTNKGLYSVDNELTKFVSLSTSPCTDNTRVVFNFKGDMHITTNAYHATYLSDGRLLQLVNGEIYIDGTSNKLFISSDSITDISSFVIDPDGHMWLSHNQDNISKLSIDSMSVSATLIDTMELGGVNVPGNNNKQISIVYKQEKYTLSVSWNIMLYSNSDKYVHFIRKDLFAINSINLVQRTGSLEQLRNNDLELCYSPDPTGYEWTRINRVVLHNSVPQLTYKLSLRNSLTEGFKTFNISVPSTILKSKQWHHISVLYKNNIAYLFIDSQLRGTVNIPYNYFLDFTNCNSLFIGSPNGRNTNLNDEIGIQDLNYTGCIDDLRLYNYAVEPSLLVLFYRAYFKGKDIVWNIPTSPIQYIESVERFFQHKIPGNKSQFYKIKISGLELQNVNDEQRDEMRSLMEKYIYEAVDELQPAYTELLKIEWV